MEKKKATKATPDVQMLRAIRLLIVAPCRAEDLAKPLGCSKSTAERVISRMQDGEVAEHLEALLNVQLFTERRGERNRERWHHLKKMEVVEITT